MLELGLFRHTTCQLTLTNVKYQTLNKIQGMGFSKRLRMCDQLNQSSQAFQIYFLPKDLNHFQYPTKIKICSTKTTFKFLKICKF